MKTLIAVPAMDQVPAQFCASLAMLKRTGDSVVGFEISSLVYTARNNLAAKAIQLGADFVLWLDSDMVFAPDILERLFADYQAGKGDIISGLYFRRAEGPFTAAPESIPDDVFEIAGCGFGCVLMPADVLMDVIGKYGNPFDPINGMGEDLSFCWRARQCGHKIVCDPAISLGHVAHMVVDRSFYDSYNSHKEGNE